MFGLFKKAKVEKVNLFAVASTLGRRFWEYEMVDGSPDTIIVKGKYRNRHQDFHKLYLKFAGENVRFTDQRGHVISEVPKAQMYPELKDIMNVL
ncbi:hypothetical protein CVD28_04300 [Bacillus sp. M6-12]|uniref:hypothetical protein n=1 Tax=Bacillus sp. M6-12 TaxID=2054166 RepID=UPI000C77AEDC|nr:hypothetical protein [Bacillus sp. M6-12]PLS19646.1 hypothetical protein CVD28_04300 [Bacillus sp. M6-12]